MIKTAMSSSQQKALRAAYDAYPRTLCAWETEAADVNTSSLRALERRGLVTFKISEGGAWMVKITDDGLAIIGEQERP